MEAEFTQCPKLPQKHRALVNQQNCRRELAEGDLEVIPNCYFQQSEYGPESEECEV